MQRFGVSKLFREATLKWLFEEEEIRKEGYAKKEDQLAEVPQDTVAKGQTAFNSYR